MMIRTIRSRRLNPSRRLALLLATTVLCDSEGRDHHPGRAGAGDAEHIQLRYRRASTAPVAERNWQGDGPFFRV